MADDGLEKQHKATPKRLDDFKKKGQTLRSRDLTSGLVFIVCIMVLFFISGQIKLRLEENFFLSFFQIRDILKYEDMPFQFIRGIILNNFFSLMPIFVIGVFSAFISPFVFGGWNFTFQPVQMKFDKMNPINNLKNMFSRRMFVNVAKSFLKVTIIIGVLVLYGISRKEEISRLINLPLYSALSGGYSIVSQFVIIISASLIFIVLFDVMFSYFEYQTKTKMTSQELKDEVKDAEGNAEVKRKLRSAQFSILRQRLSVTVPRATVVITNPTHYAVAIRYDADKDKAPKVIAKGKDYVAHQIRRISVSNGITLYEAPLLARAIYRTSKIGYEIKPELYMAVALVLSYVHQLKNYQQGLGQQPNIVSDLQIPDEFIYNE